MRIARIGECDFILPCPLRESYDAVCMPPVPQHLAPCPLALPLQLPSHELALFPLNAPAYQLQCNQGVERRAGRQRCRPFAALLRCALRAWPGRSAPLARLLVATPGRGNFGSGPGKEQGLKTGPSSIINFRGFRFLPCSVG